MIMERLALIDKIDIEAKAKSIAKATQEPTGFDRVHPTTMGVMELSPDGVNILRIDHLNQFTMSTSGKFGYGTPFETNASPRTLAIYPVSDTFSFWIAGRRIVHTEMKTLELTNATGARLIYFDEVGDLNEEASDIASIFQFYAPLASIYGNSTIQKKITFGDERHGIRMDGETHSYLHNTRGTQYFSGASINGLTNGGTTYTSIDGGTFYDEDIKHIVGSKIDTPFWFRTSSGWEISPDTNLLAYIISTVAQYNQFTTEWIVSPITNNKFALIHFYFTNDAQYPYVKILGQKQYNSKAEAKAGVLTELKKLVLDGLPTLEFKALYSIILSSNGQLELTDDGEQYIDWRTSMTASSGSSTTDETQVIALRNRAEIEELFKVAYASSYSELTYNLGNISAIMIWDTSAKGTLLFTKSITYVEGNITQIDITDHLQNATLTKELLYNNGNIISINKTII